MCCICTYHTDLGKTSEEEEGVMNACATERDDAQREREGGAEVKRSDSGG